MEKVYREAFVEIDEVLKLMPIDLVSKIPAQFRKIVSENKSEDYKCDIKEPLEEQKLKKETIVILGLIYRDFLASPEEKEKLQLKDNEELKKLEYEMQEQYKNDSFLKPKGEEKDYISQSLKIYKKPNFIKKFWRVIKGVFDKNKF